MEARVIAVIIPTIRDPTGQVRRVLAQLPANGKLMVVLAGGQEAPTSLLAVADERLRLLQLGRLANAATARNAGVAAVGEAAILAFTDDDDVVYDDWLARLVSPLTEDVADVVGGTLEIRTAVDVHIVWPAVDYWHRQALFGGNFALTSSAWAQLSGFREDLDCCEDTDLAWRAVSLALRLGLVDARVCCVARNGTGEWNQRFRWGSGAVILLRAHDIPLRNLPGLLELWIDKKQSGFCTSPLIAALAQWLGQWWQRWIS